MKIIPETGHVGTIERNLTPPLGKVITIPIAVDGAPRSFVLYVATSAFDRDQPMDSALKALATVIADRVSGQTLCALLDDCRETLDNYADVNDGADSQPVANDALRLVGLIDDALRRMGCPP